LFKNTEIDATPSPKLGPRWPNSRRWKFGDLRVRFQHSTLRGVEGRAEAPG